MKREDVLAIAQTGTGKTAAFAIPILHQLQQKKAKKRGDGIKCLVMVPTRELAIQITEVFAKLGKNTSVKAFSVFGGVEQTPQIAKLEKGHRYFGGDSWSHVRLGESGIHQARQCGYTHFR